MRSRSLAKRHDTIIPYVAMAIGVVLIGFSAIFVKWAGAAGVPGPVSAFYRLLFASGLLVPLWAVRLRQGHGTPPSWKTVGLALLCGIFFATDLGCWNVSLLLIPAADATLLGNTAPLWVGLAARVWLKERLGPRYWLGMGLALMGCWLLLGRGGLELHLGKGGLLALAAAVAYGAYILMTSRVRARLDTVGFMTLATIGGTASLLFLCLLLGHSLVGFPTSAWAAMFAQGVLTHFCGWLLASYALGHIPASAASVSLMGQALVTALLAIPLLGEGLTLVQAAGGTLVLGGIGVVNSRKQG